ncbi:uncharacterized protein LOC106474025 isoform X1 [Limulus polyphemus]|uniref:Uncharacterized protein LOC106474025 isoform X1 n=1 Tax=Limulus polyphemus TaxID=6850 RepID=A0ABM1TQG0_LIMPO|nr:uncharacterized protein LOC106474025 isoform X1 [Limulus polyphemus]
MSVHVKMEQPDDLLQVVYSDDENQDSSFSNVMNLTTETEFQREIEPGLERTCAPGKVDSLEESFLHTGLEFGKTKENKETNCDIASEKIENISVQVKVEQPDDLLQVVSKFSYSDDENQGSSFCNVMNLTTEPEFQREIESGLERTCGKYRNHLKRKFLDTSSTLTT